MYNRKIIDDLHLWKESKYRKPLVLRGARQVGKTTVLKQFGTSFKQFIYLNLEKKEDRAIFQGKQSVKEIVDALFFLKNKDLKSNDTLIFIDEIQEESDAIASLRYFYEEYPNYYVVAAGSLLESVFDVELNFPVGRVEFRVLHPFSFFEFLGALGEHQALEQYQKIPIPDFAHEKIMALFHLYTLVGGMPEAVLRYVNEREIRAVKPVYESLLLSYMDDVEKYGKRSSLAPVMRHAIASCFQEAATRIRFHGFGASNYGSREMGEALKAIEKAKIISIIYPTTQTQLPYQPDIKKAPRLQVLDTGMFNYFSGVQKDVFQSKDLNDVYNGRVIEHIVGQEMIANDDHLIKKILFWVRDKNGASSELDFLYLFEGKGYPVEVKSGKTGKLRSLIQYIEQSESTTFAIRLYAGKFQIEEHSTPSGKVFRLINLPYYLAGRLKEYIEWNNTL